MHNYIKAELYRNFNRAYLWVLSAIFALIALLLNIMSSSKTSMSDMFEISMSLLVVPVFLVLMIVDITTGEEQKNLTLKNAVSFGLSRTKLVISKLFVATILSLIAAIIILSVYFGSGLLIFGSGSGSKAIIARDALKLLTAVPLWTGAIAIGNFLALFLSSNTVFAFLYGGIFLLFSKIIKLLIMFVSDKFMYIYNYLITTQLGNLGKTGISNHSLAIAALTGAAYTIAFTIIAILYTNKKEIK